MEQTQTINIPVSWQDVKLEQGKQIFLIDRTILSGQNYIETVYEILTEQTFDSIPLDQVSEIENRIHQLLSSKIEIVTLSSTVDGINTLSVGNSFNE